MTQNTVTSSLWQIVFSILFTASCMANELPATQGDAVPLISESKEELPSTQGDNIPLISESKEKILDSGQEKASAMLVDVSRWFDNFFDDDRFLDEENKTRAKLKTTLEYSENDDF
ncbi:MAG: hypothetical protein GY702_04200, partial [Desulfobulbaceae bacterium]|nr:hypothetical protein [Desulfobulbaceae bacterium]